MYIYVKVPYSKQANSSFDFISFDEILSSANFSDLRRSSRRDLQKRGAGFHRTCDSHFVVVACLLISVLLRMICGKSNRPL